MNKNDDIFEMSETLSQDPENVSSGFGGQSYPSQSTTPSSTVQEVASSTGLPPFATFSSELDTPVGSFTSTGDGRLFTDTRLLDISNWDYYGEGLTGRLLERTENGLSIITSQPQYRPWESTTKDSSGAFAVTTPVTTFADAFAQNGVSKLPSFQSQFQSYNDPNGTETSLTTLTNLTPVSPTSSSPQQNLNFHTLSTVNPRNYPLVPAPVQAREIPSIQQQFLDERHIQMYTPTNITTLSNTIHPSNIFPGHNGTTTIIQGTQLIQSPTVVTVLKPEPNNLLKLDSNITALQDGLKIQNLHPTQFQNPMSTILDNGYNGLDKKINGFGMGSPTRNDFRKKERRKMRASSLESSATESDGASSNMEMGENSGQVAAISSTAGFKSPHGQNVHQGSGNGQMEVDMEISGGQGDKQVKKKRKRCGECIGCQRKDNCGDCAPCRNDKSHQICKQRRCEKLTEKKVRLFIFIWVLVFL